MIVSHRDGCGEGNVGGGKGSGINLFGQQKKAKVRVKKCEDIS